MDKTQKVIVALLVIAIIFSVLSIIVSLASFSDLELPQASPRYVDIDETQSGSVSLVVESSEGGGG